MRGQSSGATQRPGKRGVIRGFLLMSVYEESTISEIERVQPRAFKEMGDIVSK
jgi:hypothetical protein